MASTNPTQSHPVAAEGGSEQTTTTHPLTAPNPVATEGGEESSLAMADDEVRVLWCLIQDESTPFEVIAPVNASINQLKKLVKEEGIDVTERDSILSKHMTLWEVSILEASIVIAANV